MTGIERHWAEEEAAKVEAENAEASQALARTIADAERAAQSVTGQFDPTLGKSRKRKT